MENNATATKVILRKRESFKKVDCRLSLSEPGALSIASSLSGMSEAQILAIVGIYERTSFRAGGIKGELIQYVDGSLSIRSAYSQNVLWRSKCPGSLNLKIWGLLL